MQIKTGTRLGVYEILAPIGAGGMGEVFRARDTTLGRDAAIKVLPEAFSREPERMARFEREARMLASLSHPHIASIYGAGSAEGVRFLAMEMVEGEELAALIARGPLPVAETVSIARQIAEALESAHEKGIVHRDLKPANVKLTPDGTVKLLDFGLAKAFEGDPLEGDPAGALLATITTPMTAPHVILGTAAYMSPEQARGKPVDRRADIWAFGCVLYECLTGSRAFPGETVSDTLAKVLEREPDLGKLPQDTPPRLRELLGRCLVKDARQRLRDIGDARILLGELLAQRSPSGRLLSTDLPESATSRHRPPVLPLAIAAVVGLALGAALWGAFAPRAHHDAGAEAGPRCLSVAMPENVRTFRAYLTVDGRTVIVVGVPRMDDGSYSPDIHVYARRLGDYEYHEVPGTAGVVGGVPNPDGRTVTIVAPVAPGASQLRLARAPIDGSAPPTTVADWKSAWNLVEALENGDLLVREGTTSYVLIPGKGGQPSPPIQIDAGRPGVSRYEFEGGPLPGGRGQFVDVVLYDARGWHFSVGVMDLENGKVKIVEEDGGNARYSPTGHIVFSRGDAILAAPFDLGRLELRSAPVAVWSGLSAAATYLPARFELAEDGALFYQPGQLGSARAIVMLDAAGRVSPWSSKPKPMSFVPIVSPDGRRVACQFLSSRGIDEIWISPVERDDFQRLGTESNADAFFATWSPDSRNLAYRRKGSDDKDGIYVMSVDGGEATRILAYAPGEGYYDANSWLPDGSGLLLTHALNGVSSIAFLPRSNGGSEWGSPVPVLSGEFRHELPMLSPDGRVLAFQSDETGKLQSYVIAFHSGAVTGRPVRIATTGSAWHGWGAEGTLFVQDERGRLMKVTIASGAQLSASAPIEVCDLENLRVAGSFWAALPEGRFLLALRNANEAEVTHYDLVLNWTAELERRMRPGR